MAVPDEGQRHLALALGGIVVNNVTFRNAPQRNMAGCQKKAFTHQIWPPIAINTANTEKNTL